MARPAATSAKKINRLEKQAEALRLRKKGKTYAAIAEELGISVSAAYNLVKEKLEELKATAIEDASLLRVLQAERLELIYAIAMEEAIDRRNVNALNIALSAIGRICTLYNLNVKPTPPIDEIAALTVLANAGWIPTAKLAPISALIDELKLGIREILSSSPDGEGEPSGEVDREPSDEDAGDRIDRPI